ncbi:PREDICTED: putative disease resistance protein RGA3 [Populus euphratica]|uniref:Disease resistance protein RGA3 n=1 Tax=Populus euphratica TaxID=75702 RepID=A0AAJ6VF95_POPEU|nr:PREDICTED: putative disease resistance protein RGA3 [Populus euphratica]
MGNWILGNTEHALLDHDNGSRILATTRNEDVANFSTGSSLVHVYRIEPSTQKGAWDLFCNKAFRFEFKGQCPKDLEELSRDIVRRCGGLPPRAIVTVSGLLATKEKTILEWKKALRGPICNGGKFDTSKKFKLTRAAKLPTSIRKLHDLESLDLRNSFVEELPVEISTFPELRHLLADDRKTRALKIHGSIKHLEFLQTLFLIKVDRDLSLSNDGLQVSTKMRKLGIINLKREHGSPINIFSSSSAAKSPSWIPKLNNLAELSLSFTNLMDDSIKVPQALPNLNYLALARAYNGEKMHFEGGGFQKLKFLSLAGLSNLNEMLINEGALSLLKRLEMGPCPKLNKIVRHIPILRYDATYDPNDEGSYGAFG